MHLTGIHTLFTLLEDHVSLVWSADGLAGAVCKYCTRFVTCKLHASTKERHKLDSFQSQSGDTARDA